MFQKIRETMKPIDSDVLMRPVLRNRATLKKLALSVGFNDKKLPKLLRVIRSELLFPCRLSLELIGYSFPFWPVQSIGWEHRIKESLSIMFQWRTCPNWSSSDTFWSHCRSNPFQCILLTFNPLCFQIPQEFPQF